MFNMEEIINHIKNNSGFKFITQQALFPNFDIVPFVNLFTDNEDDVDGEYVVESDEVVAVYSNGNIFIKDINMLVDNPLPIIHSFMGPDDVKYKDFITQSRETTLLLAQFRTSDLLLINFILFLCTLLDGDYN